MTALQTTLTDLGAVLRRATSVPSLDCLREHLERAERDLFRADYCESTERATAEAADARNRIKLLSEQIARIEESL